MEKLIKLAQKLDKEFKDSNFNIDTFHLLAAEKLKEVHLDDITIENINSYIDNHFIENQFVPDDSFGEPSLTLFRSDEMVLDILIWTTGDTNAHSHGFTGAFKVMQGEIVQATYKTDKDISKPYDLLIRDRVSLSEVKILRMGDIQRIPSGLNLIHKSLHTVSPTINLVFRTTGHREAELGMCQHSVYFPDLLISPFRPTIRLGKKVSFINSLLKSSPELGLPILDDLMIKISDSNLVGLKRIGITGIRFSKYSQEVFLQKIDDELLKRNLFDTLENSKSYEINFNSRLNNLTNDKLTRTIYSLLECRLPLKEIKIFLADNKISFTEEELYEKIISYYKNINELRYLSVHLNETAFMIFEMLVRSCSEDEIIDKFINDFDISAEVAKNDILNTTSTLKDLYYLNFLI
jgi:hypothetical protein